MRRLSVFTTLGVLAVASSAFAASTKVPEAWASGSLDRFDATTRTVIVKQGTHEMTFSLAPTAHVVQGKKTLQPNDLLGDMGHQVKVRYSVKGATKVADRIQVGDVTSTHASTTPIKSTAKPSTPAKSSASTKP